MTKTAKFLLIITLILTIILAVIGTYIIIKHIDKNSTSNTSNGVIDNGNNPERNEYAQTDEEIKRTQELEAILKNNLPKMDGSTSTIPLEGGIISALFDVSQETAETGIVHSTTYGSFDNLIAGKCDIIFSTPLSDEQYTNARNANVELVEVPIVYEGFVFVVNATNPVDTLTQEQIKDIYSGKITNWKEVGGNDAEIVAYQRNETSGSQNYMKTFMGDTALMEPKTTFTPGSMSGLMDAIATYDNAENAIGYSVYAYAANMYGNGNEIKFIKVDGVEPTKQTMAEQQYPLLNYNYAIYDKSKEASTNVDELVEWILTYNGQVAMVNAGYIPVKNVAVKELEIVPYTSKGTSAEVQTTKADDFHYYVSVGEKVETLKDKELQAKINSFIDESKQKLQEKEAECEKYVELLNNAENINAYRNTGVQTRITCRNGYLSVKVLLCYEFDVRKRTRVYIRWL